MIIELKTHSIINFNKPQNANFKEWDFPHVYLLNSQNCPNSIFQKLGSMLNEEEIGRAQKFRFEKDRREFIVARGALKILISRYFRFPKLGMHQNLNPKDIKFEKEIFGKPKLATHSALMKDSFSDLKFNVSHSNGMIAIAFNFDGNEVGVDIEKVKEPFDYQGIVDNYFMPKEKIYINSEEQFFELWTRKEAILKITGVGLTNDLTNLNVAENGTISSFEDERFLPFLNKIYYLNSFRIEEYWVSLATETNADFQVFDLDFFDWT